MTVSPGRFGFNQKMVVLDKSNNHRDFVEPHLHLLISPINEAVAARKAEIERRRKQERFVISMDFTTIRDYLDKGGVVLTAVKCPQCGGAVELPKSGSLTKCGYCGTALQAQDIFERIKGLLG